jgi:hypothetical protein
VIDTTRRSTIYESRLLKYLKRGFGIIMPDFNMTKIENEYLFFKHNLKVFVNLPYLKITVKNVKYNYLEFDDDLIKKKDVSDYYDITIRKQIKIDGEFITSYKTFMDSYNNKYIVHSFELNNLVNNIVDYKNESQANKTTIDRFINNNFVIKPIWLKINPGTQLTGSFNPIIDHPKMWYGIYYINDKNWYGIMMIVLLIIFLIIIRVLLILKTYK